MFRQLKEDMNILQKYKNKDLNNKKVSKTQKIESNRDTGLLQKIQIEMTLGKNQPNKPKTNGPN